MSLITIILLSAIIAAALFLPFLVHKVEKELEIFLFILGVLSATVSGIWSFHLAEEALKEPIAISLAVLITGLLFRRFRDKMSVVMEYTEAKLGLKPTIVLVVFILSFLSSLITAIVAALILCEIAALLRLSRRDTVHVIVMGCFGIGLGAILTPIGEPLSTIVTNKLAAPPHNAGVSYLFKLLWPYVVPGVIAFSFAAAFIKDKQNTFVKKLSQEDIKDIVIRAAKVFLFVMALVLFGQGLMPLSEITVTKLPVWALYWVNSISAILDNATLAAAEIVPSMSEEKIIFLLMGLIISGGLLIPGNIPNIICASKFKITSKEWAKAALPLGIAAMVVYFAVLMFVFER